jgi:hypothetical protein
MVSITEEINGVILRVCALAVPNQMVSKFLVLTGRRDLG